MKQNLPLQNKRQSFILEIISQENQTWQGTIHWVEGKKKEYFRSALEMIRLIDSTIKDTDEKNSEEDNC